MKKFLLVLAAVCLTATFAMADGAPVTWNVSGIQLNNPTYNYTWDSPTAIATNYEQYYYEYNIVKLEANFWFGWSDVTDTLRQYAGENMSGSGTVAGPAPVTLFNETVENADPQATIDMMTTIDELGYAHVLVREMSIGSLPIVGTPSAIKLWVDVTATPLGDPIPEPVSMILLGTGALPLLLRRKK